MVALFFIRTAVLNQKGGSTLGDALGGNGREDEQEQAEEPDAPKGSRVLLAEALIRNTSLLLLDEPTAFLDVPRSIDLFKLLKSIAVNENKGILISTHQVEHALKYADRLLVFLRNGQVVSGLVEDVLKSGALSWAALD